MRFSSSTRRKRPAFPTTIEIFESRTLLTPFGPSFDLGDRIDLDHVDHEVPSIDGTGNNRRHSEWGSTEIALLRLAEADYADGFSDPAGEDRPSARAISNGIAAAEGDIPNDRHLTDMLWIWGQFIDHDLDLTEPAHPEEPYHIAVPHGDPFFDPFHTGTEVIELHRSTYEFDDDGVRQQINQITAFLDGSVVYGSDSVRADALRTFEGGKLKTSEGDFLPYNVDRLPNAGGPSDRLFLAGDVRANENAALTSMHTIWVREHNRLAEEIAGDKLWLGDEEIYQEARAKVRAELQVITYNEFLPALLGADAVRPYRGYRPQVNPGIANEFSTAAYRFGHSLLSSELLRLDADGNVIDAGNLALRDAFFRPGELVENGIDPLLRGASTQLAQELDNQVVDDVRNFLFGPPGAGGFDLASLNIQRGRDHGLSSYNDTREALGLKRVQEFSDITSDSAVAGQLAALYDDVDEIDLWVGGLAEDHRHGSSMGETFNAIIADQFERIRDGDRFWYENVFHGRELRELEQTTLAEVIRRNTGIGDLQENVFFAPDVLYVDLSAERGSRVTVQTSAGQIEVVDQHRGRVIASGSLAEIDRLVIVGSNRRADQITIRPIAAAALSGGIEILAGSRGGDHLEILGTTGDDEIHVSADQISVNGFVTEFEGIDRITIQPKRGDDDVQTDEDVDIPVHVKARHRHHFGHRIVRDLFDRLFGSEDFLDDLFRRSRRR